jgi:voltage-gated potassium channel
MTIRRRIYLILEPTEKGGILERIFEFLLIAIIVLNILAIVSESIKEVHEEYAQLFHQFEIFSVIFFTIEYVLRIYSTDGIVPDFQGCAIYASTFDV